MKNLHYIAFDADDTLWLNEPYFKEAELIFCQLMAKYLPHEKISEELFKTEMQNLPIYGYGIKAFSLSMLETALRISNNKLDSSITSEIVDLGKSLLNKPVEVLSGVREVLETLSGNYQLVVATKGDLLDQKQKLVKSGLIDYFHHAEIMSDKRVADYQKLINQLGCQPTEFLMIGNSLKSDVLPILEIGGYAAHVPYDVTWAHEVVEGGVEHPNFVQIENIIDILEYVK